MPQDKRKIKSCCCYTEFTDVPGKKIKQSKTLRWNMRLMLSANSSLLAHSRSVHISAQSHVPPLPHTTVNLLELTCYSASAKNESQLQSEPKMIFSHLPGLVFLFIYLFFSQIRLTGLPWALVSLSWSWAARGDVASCPENTIQAYPVMAALRCPPCHSLENRKNAKM